MLIYQGIPSPDLISFCDLSDRLIMAPTVTNRPF